MAESKKILVVDDDQVFVKLVENDLTKQGFTIVTANNGNRAITITKREKPDLILLDINMPDIDGGEVGNILASDPLTKNIPIIFLTSLLTKKEEERRKNIIRGHYFMAKPYNLETLLKEIYKFM